MWTQDGVVGMNQEVGIEIYTLPCVKWIARGKLPQREFQLSALVTLGRGDRWGDGKEVHERGNICIHIADSLYCIAETNTTL